jgi:hypothetical protein
MPAAPPGRFFVSSIPRLPATQGMICVKYILPHKAAMRRDCPPDGSRFLAELSLPRLHPARILADQIVR